jgi:integrase
VDRVFPGVGRINVVSGATTEVVHRARNALLTKLYHKGMLEILRAIKRGDVTIPEVYSDELAGRLDYTIAGMMLRRPLWPMVDAWLPASAPAQGTRERYEDAVGALKRMKVLGPAAAVGDLEAVDWRAVFNMKSLGPAGWNRTRAMISAFLSATLRDKWHPFRRSVMAKMPRAAEPEGRVPDLPPALFWQILERVPEAVRPCYVTMVATGMGPGEYVKCEATDLFPHTFSLRVHGTKLGRQGDAIVRVAKEAWPWVVRAVPCAVSQDQLYRLWKRACRAAGRPDLRLYDLRHCFGQWLSEAGAPEAHIQVAMRHKTAAMTRRYTKQRDKGRNAQVLAGVLFPPSLQLVAGSYESDSRGQNAAR